MQKVSVVLPVFNAASTIDRCVRSVLEQSYSNFELIIVNDGSTDDSEFICRMYSQNDQRVTVITQENQGVSSARNAGLLLASGYWVTFIDSDDYVSNQWLSHFFNRGIDEDLLVQGFTILKSGAEKLIKTELVDVIGQGALKGHGRKDLVEFLIKLSKKYVLGYLWCKMFKLELIRNNRIQFNSSYKLMEDEDFVLNYCLVTRSFSYSPTFDYQYTLPNYSNKYEVDINCINELWKTILLLSSSFNERAHFANRYSEYYILALNSTYTRVNRDLRLKYVSDYLILFAEYKINYQSFSSKVFKSLLSALPLNIFDKVYINFLSLKLMAKSLF